MSIVKTPSHTARRRKYFSGPQIKLLCNLEAHSAFLYLPHLCNVRMKLKDLNIICNSGNLDQVDALLLG